MSVSISNVKVNNTPVTQTVRVTDGRPMIAWKFVGDIINVPTVPPQGISTAQETSQAAFEVRISTSNTNLGSSSFSGTFASGEITSEDNFWRYDAFDIVRGSSTYYGQVRVKDQYGNYSGWSTFSFTFNTLPAVFSVAITPATPSFGDSLQVTYTFASSNGHEGNTQIRWFRNGVQERWLDGRATIPPEYAVAGDVWVAIVRPHDGVEYGVAATSSAVTVRGSLTTAVPVENAKVLPQQPTPLDPLYAYFDYAGDEPVHVQWYVNEELMTEANDHRFFRFPLTVGDSVYFNAFTDTSGSDSQGLAEAVVVAPAPYQVVNLRINGDPEPLNVPNQTPAIWWDVLSPDSAPFASVARVTIGSGPGLFDVYNASVVIPDNRFIVPKSLLRFGADYWVSVSVGTSTDTLGPPAEAHFRLTGSLWENYVSNSTGWTVEASVYVSAQYQTIRLSDGTKFAEVQLYPDQVQVVTKTTTAGSASLGGPSRDTLCLHAVTITGQGSEINVYVDQALVVTATLDQLSNEKYIEFGTSVAGGIGDWASVVYSVDGVKVPGTPAYEEIAYKTAIDFAQREITDVDRWNTYSSTAALFTSSLLVSTETTDSTAEFFKFNPFGTSVMRPTVSRTYSPINRITTSPDGRYVYFSHANGATWIKSRPVVRYDQLLNLKRRQPEDYGWTLFISNDESTTVSDTDGIVIDTTEDGGKWYYAQDRHGTPWFDSADNSRGWTFDFTLRVDAVKDDNDPVDHGLPEGVGVYVNDGAFSETINFFTNEVVLGSTGASSTFDTTQVTDYRLTGVGNQIELWAKPDADSAFELISKGVMTRQGTQEGNGGRPHACTDGTNNLHAVWHDDGRKGGRQIMYSRYTSGGWTLPQVIVPSEFNASNPRIVAHGTNLHVVFEQRSSEYCVVGYVVKNDSGWGQPTTLLDGGSECRNPQIAIDGGEAIYVAWEDYRNLTPAIRLMARRTTDASWADLGQVNTSTQPCTRPAMDAESGYVALSWTQRVSDTRTSIFARVYNTSGPTWTAATDVSSADSADADYSDLLIQGAAVQIVWHDNRVDEYQIYTHRLTMALVTTQATQALTSNASNGSVSSRFPKIGFKKNSTTQLVVVYQRSNDVDEQAGTGGLPTPSYSIYASVYDTGGGTWYTNNVLMNTASRYSHRPAVAREFSGNAHILYEAEILTTATENLSVSDTFTNIRDTEYDFTLTSSYTVTTSLDHVVSGQLPRREIRFGDFSDSYKAAYAFSKIGLYLHGAIDPYEVGLISASRARITDDRSYDAMVNNTGDAWIGTQAGLSLYLRSQNKIVTVDRGALAGSKVTAVAIDTNGVLFAASGSTIYSSADHFTFGIAVVAGGNVADMTFDASGTLWVATDNGTYAYPSTADFANGTSPVTLGAAVVSLRDDLGFGFNDVRSVAVDPNGFVWICTAYGLYAYKNGRTLSYQEDQGLPSNFVSGIAIRSPNVRYVATASGVAEMVGERFTRLTADKTPWNNNPRAILFQKPNTLWVSAMSDICQVQLDDDAGDHATLTYGISNYAPDAIAYNNLRTFYVTSLPAGVDDGIVAEVWVNGRRCDFGYTISSDHRVVQFETPLLASDVVQVNFRLDLRLHATLRQNKAEVEVEGKSNSKIDHFTVTSFVSNETGINPTYGKTLVHSLVEIDGHKYLYRHDATPNETVGDVARVPFDDIVLDTTPPTGELKIISQIDRYTMKLAIEYADDNLSGVAKMRVTNFANGTTDGTTPAEFVDYAPTVIHTVDQSLDYILTTHTFDANGPKGHRIVKYKIATDNDTFYVGTQFGANILRYNPTTTIFETVAKLDGSPAASVDFMCVFKNWLVVGVGKVGGSTRILYTADGRTFTLVGSIAAQHAYAACSAFDNFYVGGTDGKVYSWDGGNPSFSPLRLVTNTGQQTIWAIQSGNGQLYIATGDQGNLIAYDPFADSQIVCYTDPDPNITALDVLSQNGVFTLFLGDGNRGTITSKKVAASTRATTSFQYVPSRVTAIKIDDAGMRFAIGDKMWTGTAIPTFSGWTPFATFAQNIEDFAPAATTGLIGDINVWVVTQDKVYNVQPPNSTKKFYLQLMDNAGNVTVPGTIFDGISVNDLIGYVNTNRILTINRSGLMVDYIDGNAPYFSVNQVERETGEYYSEVFFGTNNLIAWDLLTFDCDTPAGTDVTIYLRTANSRDAVLTSDWQASYGSNFKNGINITFLQGRYLQFKAVLSTTETDATPILRRVVIRSKTSESTHFFTTNFILGSKIKKGLLTSQQIVPVSAEIVWGINTLNSQEFADYQTVTVDKIFTADETQIGTDVRVAIKLITPTPGMFVTDNFGETGPGDTPLYVNTIEFDHGNIASTFHYRVQFYSDAGLSDLVYTAFSQSAIVGWTVDGTALTFDGVPQHVGSTKRLAFAPTGDTPLLCNTYYYVKISAYDLVAETFTTVVTGNTFISACNTSFVDVISFDHTAATAATYQFRVRFYNDIERTDLVKVYYTGTNASLWMAGASPFPSGGLPLTLHQTAMLTFTPPLSDMVLDKVYYLSIDAFDGTSFGEANNSLTFRVSDPVSATYCGEYANVPIVEKFGLVLTLEDGREVRFSNLNL